jgi:hypothetical protein
MTSLFHAVSVLEQLSFCSRYTTWPNRSGRFPPARRTLLFCHLETCLDDCTHDPLQPISAQPGCTQRHGLDHLPLTARITAGETTDRLEPLYDPGQFGATLQQRGEFGVD